jgi:Sec-independent protein secretion pathway component TatC
MSLSLQIILRELIVDLINLAILFIIIFPSCFWFNSEMFSAVTHSPSLVNRDKRLS